MEYVAALQKIGELERPIAVLLNLARHEHLMVALEEDGSGEILHTDGEWAVWVFEPATTLAMNADRVTARASDRGARQP